jgi:Ca2+-binding RTX toxin-like protein
MLRDIEARGGLLDGLNPVRSGVWQQPIPDGVSIIQRVSNETPPADAVLGNRTPLAAEALQAEVAAAAASPGDPMSALRAALTRSDVTIDFATETHATPGGAGSSSYTSADLARAEYREALTNSLSLNSASTLSGMTLTQAVQNGVAMTAYYNSLLGMGVSQEQALQYTRQMNDGFVNTNYGASQHSSGSSGGWAPSLASLAPASQLSPGMNGGYYSPTFCSYSTSSSSDTSGNQDPVVLDLDGDGVELVARSASHAFYDLNGDGFLENVGWASGDDALLAIDLNGDGIINQTSEINFAHGVAGAATDLDGIRLTYDSNRDGVLDARDARFADFRVWHDVNADGVSDPSELRTLTEAGITSVGLTGSRVDENRDGNTIARYTHYTRADGTTGQVGDAGFSTSAFGYRFNPATGSLDLRAESLAAVAAVGRGGTVTAADGTETLLVGDEGAETLRGGTGSDWLYGGGGGDALSGGAGNDILFFDAADTIDGGDGFDIAIVTGEAGVTVDLGAVHVEGVVGGNGADRLTGTERAEYLGGGAGNDTLDGGAGNDTLVGGAGNDRLTGGAGADIIYGGSGNDTLDYSASAAGVAVNLATGLGAGGDAEGDMFRGVENLTGSAQADRLTGDDGANRLTGGAGADRLDGGAGDDTADYATSAEGVVVSLAGGWGLGGDAEGDRLTNIDNVTGSAHGDWLLGDGGVNVLSGGAGDDVLAGGGGTDTLLGGDGDDDILAGLDDRVDGGTGHDEVRLDGEGRGAVDRTWTNVEHVIGSDGGDRLWIGGGTDGSSTGPVLDGAGGADELGGSAGANTLDGGAGNDLLLGSGGDDTYAFGRGSGHDTVYDAFHQTFLGEGAAHVEASDRDAGNDTLRFGPGIAAGDLILLKAGDNLLVGLRQEGVAFDDLADRVTIRDFFRDNNRIETFRFADGSTTTADALGIGQYLTTAVDAADQSAHAAEHANDGSGLLAEGAERIARLEPAGSATALDAATAGAAGPGDEARWQAPASPEPRAAAGAEAPSAEERERLIERAAAIAASDQTPRWGVELPPESATAEVPAETSAPQRIWGVTPSPAAESVAETTPLAPETPAETNVPQRSWGVTPSVSPPPSEENDLPEGEDGTVSWDRRRPRGSDVLLARMAAEAAELSTLTILGLTVAQAAAAQTIETADEVTHPGTAAVSSVTPPDTPDREDNSLLGPNAAPAPRGAGAVHAAALVEGEVLVPAVPPTEDRPATSLVEDGRPPVVLPDNEADVAAIAVLADPVVGTTADGGSGAVPTPPALPGFAAAMASTPLDGDWPGLRGGDGDDLFIIDKPEITPLSAIDGRSGTDTVVFSTDRDIVFDAGTRNIEVVKGGSGNDRFYPGEPVESGVRFQFEGGAGDDVLWGGQNRDHLDGGLGSDRLAGMDGDDLLIGGQGADVLDGGAGTDRADYAGSAAGVSVDVAAGTGSGGDAEGDRLSGIEDLSGSVFGDDLRGDGGANDLDGGAGDDELDGRGGADRLVGGDGDDLLIGGLGADLLDGGAGAHDRADYRRSSGGVWVDLAAGAGLYAEAHGDRLAGIEDLTGSAFGDELHGDDGANTFDGGAGNDWLDGRDGDDTLYGGEGDDWLTGGLGADVLDGGAGTDRADYRDSTQGVTVDLVSGTGTGGEAENDRLTAIEDLAGSVHADALSGDGGANIIEGGAGDDRLDGRDGADTLRGGEGDDLLIGGSGADRLDGGAGIDRADYSGSTGRLWIDLAAGAGLYAEAEGDRLAGIENLTGSAFDDELHGDDGANALDGGSGNDWLDGRSSADALHGGEGDDWLTGGLGADLLDGGAGIDRADYSGSAQGVSVDLVSGVGIGGEAEGDRLVGVEDLTGSVSADVLSGDEGTNVIESGAGEDRLDGRGGADTLYSGEGDDWLTGGLGADVLDGGAGTDRADYRDSAQGVTVDLVSGTGTGGEAEGDRLTGIEDLTGSAFGDELDGDGMANALDGGDGHDRLDGRDGADDLRGGAGDDLLIGGLGADRLDGGAGGDGADYSGSMGGVWVDLATGAGRYAEAEGDWLTGIENLTGSSHNDALFGDGGANALAGGAGDDLLSGRDGDDVINGGDGDDWLAGGQGADTLDGGAGIDVADYADSAQGVNVDLAMGAGTGGDAQGDRLPGIEDLSGSVFGDDLRGDGGANDLDGGAGDDELDGRGGADRLVGGDGDDLLIGGLGADLLDGGAGAHDRADYRRSSGGVWVDLAAGAGLYAEAHGDRLVGVEDLTGSAFGDELHGDGGANALDGGSGNDRLDGRGGADILWGGEGDDLLIGGQGADVLDGGAGIDRADYRDSAQGVTVDLVSGTGSGGEAEGDRLTGIEDLAGSAHADVLSGDEGANVIEGGTGDDRLIGGRGADRLDGGAGTDRADYARSATGVIVDLATGAGTGGDAQGDQLVGIEDLAGSAYGDALSGDAGANAIDGGAGDDVLIGGLGADDLDGGAGGHDRADYRHSTGGVWIDLATGAGCTAEAEGDRLTGIEDLTGSAFGDELLGDGGANALDGGDGNDRLDGRGGADDLGGGEGDDLLIGGLGADELDGGAGIDRADYRDSAQGVTVDLSSGTGSGGDAEGDRLTGIEDLAGSAFGDDLRGDGSANVFDGGAGDDALDGHDGEDTLLGGVGDDLLIGGLGADRLDGGAGVHDRAEYRRSSGGVWVDLASGAGLYAEAHGDRLVGVEDLTGSVYGDELRGDGGANTFEGGAGNDWLDGRDGADVLTGGEGDDLLIGGRGADVLDGGEGADRADYTTSAQGVTVDLASGAGIGGEAEGDRLTGIENLTGSAFGDDLRGGDGANALDSGAGDDALDGREGDDTLLGGDGDDRLIGGLGADVLDGGAGIDRADYTGSDAGVYVDLALRFGAGGHAYGDVLLNIDDVEGSQHADTLLADQGTNRLWGGAGNDRLDGRGGDDRLSGGDGGDWLIGGLGADVLDGGAGVDAVDYSGSGSGVQADLVLGRGSGGDAEGDRYSAIEDVVGTGWNDTIIGNALDNRLEGGEGDDGIIGGAGADWLNGGAGRDRTTYDASDAGVYVDLLAQAGSGGDAQGDRLVGIEDVTGSRHADTLLGDDRGNTLIGLDGNDRLDGRDGDDRLEGGAGDDWLVGGRGGDTLVGGDGRDTLDYSGSTAGVLFDVATGIGSGGDAEGDRASGVENLKGSRFADTVSGNDGDNQFDGLEGDDRLAGAGGNDTLFGGAGDDVLWGGDGADWLDGGGGFDAAVYDDASGGVWADLGAGRGIAGAAAGDTLIGIERLIGSRFNDTLVGGAEGDRLDGGLGDDVLMGNGGDDRLFGDDGNDQLWGGAGNDDLRGGNGSDIVNYAGNWNGYRIERGASGGATITDARPDLNGDEGRDSLTGIEELRFADRTYYLDGRNNAPIALADGVVTDEDVSVVISAASLAANDTDFDGDPLTIGTVADAVHGTVWLDHGNVVFRPDAGYHGAASFTYRASDGRGGVSEGTTVSVRVNPVNDAPIAHNDSFRGAIATQDFRMSMSSLLANDSDPDGDTLRIASVGGCADGSVWLDGKDVVFRAKSHAVDGTITFTYTVTDDHGGNTSASASLQVSGFNNAPFALEDDICLTPEGYYSSFGYIYDSDLLDNDCDLDGDKIKIRTLSLVDCNDTEYSAVRGPSGGIIVRGSGQSTTWIVRYSIEDEYGAVSGIRESKVCVLLKKPPIVLDLDGDGVELVNVRDSSAHFDMDGDGSRDLTGWASADDGILVYDQNGDHQIDRHEEVVLSSWGTPGMTDLEGLAYAFDSNHDGVFDHRDAEWSRFAVWQDRNQDGSGTLNEVRSLEEAGITAVHLQRDDHAEDIAGNHVYGYAVYDTSDGGHGKVADAAFSYTPTPPAGGGASPLTVAGPTAEGHAPVTGVSSVEGNAGDAPAGLPSGIASAGGEASSPDSPGHASSVPATGSDDAGLHQLASMMAAFDAQAETMDVAPPIEADQSDALDLDHRIAA